MDGFHRHQQQQNPGGGSFWYPSSSPPAAAVAAGYHMPHTLAAGYHAPPHPPIYHHQRQCYSNQHPIPPQHQHQQWFHPQQQPPPPTMPMPPQGAPLPHHPPPYHGLPPPYTLTQHRHPPSQPHPMVTPPPPAYPPSSQAWGNPSWTQHQVGDYPDRNIHYSSEEDWAAKARAWAVGNSFPEPHHTHSQFTPVGRMDEHEYSYQQPRLSTSNGRTLYNEDETVSKEAGDLASPPKSYYSSSSIYEQEVPYSYSSSQGNKEGMDQRECSLERLHSQFISPVQMSSVQQPHFDPGNRPAKASPDACNQPLDFQPRSTLDTNQCNKISYSSVDHVVAEGTLDQDITTAPFQTWNSSAALVVVFPPIPLAPSGTQFDPAFASQTPLPIHPAPVFGGITAPNFQAPVSPVSAPFGLGVGPSLNSAFPGDANGAFNISERPKKAAVPSWLREEIIKKKSAIASTNSVHFEAIEMEDGADMSFRRTDQADNNSVDSKRSTENEEDDEDEVETARSAAINQEIKRVLTEVLLKVTDELFDEITTKVLNEDEPRVEAVESTSFGSHRLSPVPDVQTPKASAKIVVPVKKDSKAVHVSEISSPSPPGGDILGLANYGSDASDGDYDNDESREAALPSSRKLDNSSHHLETAVSSYGNVLNNLETGKTLPTVDANDGVENERKLSLLGYTERRRNEPSRGKATGISETFEKTSSTSSRTAVEIQKDNAKGFKSSDNAGDEGGSKNESANGEGNIIAECENGESNILSGADQKQERSQINQSLRREVEAGLLKNDYENNKLGDEQKEKINKRYKLNEQVGDRNFQRRTPTRSTSRSNSFKNSRKEIMKDRGEKGKDVERNNEHKRDRKEDDRRGGKEDRSTRVTRETLRRNSRSKSPVCRGRKMKDTSMNRHGGASSEESSDNSRKRKLQPRRNSLSASPTRSRKRQVSWSPHSRHSHHREYPYSTRNRRSRTPTPRRKSSKQLQT